MKTSTKVLYSILIFIAVSTIGLLLYSERQEREIWPPPYDPSARATQQARIDEWSRENDFSPQVAGYIQHQDKIYRHTICGCGGEVGVPPCDDTKMIVITKGEVATVNPVTIPSCGGMGYAYPFGGVEYDVVDANTPTSTPTNTPTVTPTNTPVPVIRECVKVIWDKGVVTQGLNIRNGPSMGDNADGRSYLGPGFIFEPLDIVYVPGVGWAAKVAQPNWYIFMSLDYKPNVDYAVVWECP